MLTIIAGIYGFVAGRFAAAFESMQSPFIKHSSQPGLKRSALNRIGVGAQCKGPNMGTFGKCKGGGRRSAARTTAPLLALVTTLKDSHSAALVDVSSTGARLRGTGLPHEGEALFISVEHMITFGTVAWAHDGELGVAFDRPLDSDDEQYLRQKVALTAGLPPDMKAALDDWMLGAAR